MTLPVEALAAHTASVCDLSLVCKLMLKALYSGTNLSPGTPTVRWEVDTKLVRRLGMSLPGRCSYEQLERSSKREE